MLYKSMTEISTSNRKTENNTKKTEKQTLIEMYKLNSNIH